MTPEELQKLLNLTAIELSDDQKPAFLDYFNSMKSMFDDFASFPLPDGDEESENDDSIHCFDTQVDFQGLDIIESNVKANRQVNHSVEVKSALGE